ncbi:MAG: ribosome maturation factor RimM [Flexilinea sp.]
MENDLNKQDNAFQGSSSIDEPGFVCIGKIHRSHGIQGEVVFNPMTDFPERIRKGKMVFLGQDHLPVVIESVRQKPPFLLVRFENYHDEVEAEALRNTLVFVRIQDLPDLPAGEYYFHQLIGLEAVAPDDSHIGILKEIIETGANDVYIIRHDDGQEDLVPAISDFVREVLLAEKKIVIILPEWL